MGFYERLRKEVKERGSFSMPCSLVAPCPYCSEYQAWMKEVQDVGKIHRLKTECMRTCDKVRYYDRYGINPFYDPMPSECDFLLVWINELTGKRAGGTDLTTDELDQLRVWGNRLTLVIAMEEVKVAAALSALESIREATDEL